MTAPATSRLTDTTEDLARPTWLPPDRWPFALRCYEHHRPDDRPLRIHYTDEGTGPVLVFIHAGFWSFIWRGAIAALRTDFRCITLDFPGSGLSDGDRHDVDLSTYPAIVSGLLDHCGVAQATFVIHDLGGVVGVMTAADRPGRATGLVATNTFAWPDGPRSLRTMLALMGSHTMTGVAGTLRLLPRMTRSRMGVGRHYDRGDRQAFFGPYRSRRSARNVHRAMRSARRSTRMFEQADTALRTSLQSLPTLLVFGEKNDPFHFTERWRSIFPGASTWVVEGGNHFPMCDDPEGYGQQLRQWHRRTVDPGTSQGAAPDVH